MKKWTIKEESLDISNMRGEDTFFGDTYNCMLVTSKGERTGAGWENGWHESQCHRPGTTIFEPKALFEILNLEERMKSFEGEGSE